MSAFDIKCDPRRHRRVLRRIAMHLRTTAKATGDYSPSYTRGIRMLTGKNWQRRMARKLWRPA